MSRKDYNAIAKAFKTHLDEWKGTPRENAVMQALRDTAGDLCEVFAADNPNFDPERFMRACGFPPPPMFGKGLA